MSESLPADFAALAPFVGKWALATEQQRYDNLLASGMDELQAFYDAMMPRMEAIIQHLNRFDLDAMPPPEATLLRLATTFMESAHPIDLRWKDTDIEDKFPADRFRFLGPSTQPI